MIFQRAQQRSNAKKLMLSFDVFDVIAVAFHFYSDVCIQWTFPFSPEKGKFIDVLQSSLLAEKNNKSHFPETASWPIHFLA